MKRVLDDLAIFCAVVETGSLKRTSDKLSVPHSTVSRRIEALENSLGLKLLQRTTRDVKVTARGRQLYEDCAGQLSHIKNSVAMAIDDEIQFRGKLCVSMPVRAGIDFLGGWLIDFAAKHSDLELEVSLSNDNKNLLQEGIDLAFRVGPLTDSSAIALHLWDITYVLCCHQAFVKENHIERENISIEQIQQLPCVIAKPAIKWTFVDHRQNEKTISPNAQLLVSDLGLAYYAVQGGHYLAMLPRSMLKDQDIVEVKLAGLQARTRKMYAYYLGRRHAQSQIKHLVAYAKSRYFSMQ